jgi:hypothetical protein
VDKLEKTTIVFQFEKQQLLDLRKQAINALIEGIKSIFTAITDFFSNLFGVALQKAEAFSETAAKALTAAGDAAGQGCGNLPGPFPAATDQRGELASGRVVLRRGPGGT